ncbi:unnamed protein product [Miscanthus lutarioriparius]|uniref:Transmembrane 9 superfamily member n=1 Tax=Miscanthus lutarioriparius TaxID=422564 RepID=A0A811SPN0_9POAL|nr:unnamed protein product [Miscanthus lutarioriparius]
MEWDSESPTAAAPAAPGEEEEEEREASKIYKTEEPVKLWVNKVGPYNNPQETYNYYSLPFCQPSENPAHKWGGLGEVLGGNELIDSQIDIKFIKNVDKGAICTIELDAQKVQQFANAIENSYWFELFIGFVGETDKNNENKHYLYTHKNIVIKYNVLVSGQKVQELGLQVLARIRGYADAAQCVNRNLGNPANPSFDIDT